VLAAVLVVLVVGAAIWWPGSADLREPVGGPKTAEATGAAILPDAPLPALEGGTVTVDGLGDPLFAWTNASPQPGDQYRWWLLATPDQTHLTGDAQAAVPRREFGGGPVCVEVRLIRDEQTSPRALRICECS
jgi:hypothetical protein